MTYRETVGPDQVRSGPMYYLRDGLKSPALAMAFAVVAGIAALTTTPFTQTNSIAVAMESQVGVPTWISGVVVAVLTWSYVSSLILLFGAQLSATLHDDRPTTSDIHEAAETANEADTV